MITRRGFLQTTGLGLAACGGASVPAPPAAPPVPPPPPDRLDQGPFDIDQDDGWRTLVTTTATDRPLRNPGLGLIGYTWEEGGPSLAARRGEETIEQHVEKLAALPFVDILYIRCDWRDVQRRPGKLDLHPIWPLTLDAARRHGLRCAFRVQLSNPSFAPGHIAMPEFVHTRVPLVEIGHYPKVSPDALREPRYDHPAFRAAFAELVGLLAAELDGHPLIEFADMMHCGFWGEGHTKNLASSFPDRATATRTSLEMAARQIEAFRRTPLAVNTQPDITGFGNREVLAEALRADCWLRSDSIVVEEPIQIDVLANRPPWLAAVLEDGYHRDYALADLPLDAAGVDERESAMRHVLDLGANYWSLWTEADNLRRYEELRPSGFRALRARMGYRVRPSWIWQRIRAGAPELVVAFTNDGVAGVPGVLRVEVATEDGALRVGGALDRGHPFGGRVRQASFRLPREMEGAKVALRAEIDLRPGVRRPVCWSCAQPLSPDGALLMQLERHDSKGWRKGI